MQRRLAALLAADVVGFSALMERDEEGAYAAVERLRREIVGPRLAEHQGRLAAPRRAMALQGDLSRDQGALRLRVGRRPA